MKVTTFILLALLGFFIVLSTIYYYNQIGEKYSEASNSESLRGIASKVAEIVISAIETSRDIDYAETEPVVNISFELPEKVVSESYRVIINGSIVKAVSRTGLSSGSSKLPYNVSASGSIDSRDSSHFIAVNSSGYIIYK